MKIPLGKDLDRLLEFLLVMCFAVFVGFVSLVNHFGGGNSDQIGSEPDRLTVEDQAIRLQQAEAERPQFDGNKIPPASALYPAGKVQAWQQIDWQKIFLSVQAAASTCCDKLSQALESGQKRKQCLAKAAPVAKKLEDSLAKTPDSESQAVTPKPKPVKPGAAIKIKKPRQLFPALAKVESDNNPYKIGDGGKAKGIVQIWTCVVDDVNHIVGKHWFHYWTACPSANQRISWPFIWIITARSTTARPDASPRRKSGPGCGKAARMVGESLKPRNTGTA